MDREGFPEEMSLSYDLKEILEVTGVQSGGKRREEHVQRPGVGTWCAGKLQVSQYGWSL